MTAIVDSHAHLYSPDEARYPALPIAFRPPAGTGSLTDLRRTCEQNAVQRVCAIQTQTFYGSDNRYLADVAARNRDWLAAICMVEPESTASAGLLRELVLEHGVRGLRSRAPAVGQLDHPAVRALWDVAAELGLVVNVLTSRENASGLEALLQSYPATRVVIEHSLALNITTDRSATLDALSRLAAYDNAYVELCDLPVVSQTSYPFADVHELYMSIITMYGARRCVWGSCFPLDFWLPGVTYGQHLAVFTQELDLEEQDRAEILGGTAERLWFPASDPAPAIFPGRGNG